MFLKREDFMVVPQYKRLEYSQAAVDFTTMFMVRYNEHPILFLEIKPSGHIRHNSSREDFHMQERFRINGATEFTVKAQRRNGPEKVVRVTKSIQLKSYLKVYSRVYICIAVSIHTNAQIPVVVGDVQTWSSAHSRSGVVRTIMNYDRRVAN